MDTAEKVGGRHHTTSRGNERRVVLRDRPGDWGRDLAIHLGKFDGRLSLRELADRCGGVSLSAVGKAISQGLHGVRTQMSNGQI